MTLETTQCDYCKCTFTYERKRKHKKYCSTKCALAYHNKFVRDKNQMRLHVARYYQENPAKRFYAATKASAKKRSLPFDLTLDWFEQRLESGVCELTGLPIKPKPYEKSSMGVRSFYSPSIDRIDNKVGYLSSNCRLVCWGANLVKSTFTDRDLNALSVGLMLNNLPKLYQDKLIEILPHHLLASLPAGHFVKDSPVIRK